MKHLGVLSSKKSEDFSAYLCFEVRNLFENNRSRHMHNTLTWPSYINQVTMNFSSHQQTKRESLVLIPAAFLDLLIGFDLIADKGGFVGCRIGMF